MLDSKDYKTRYVYDYTFTLKPGMWGPDIKSQKKPVACIVMRDGKAGVSICHKNDVFAKKRARLIAAGRLEKEHVCAIPPRKKVRGITGGTSRLYDIINEELEVNEIPGNCITQQLR